MSEALLISLIIVLQWINELYLLKIFREKKFLKIKLYLFFNIFFYLTLFLAFFSEKTESLNLYIVLFALVNILYLLTGFLKGKYSEIFQINSTLNIFITDLYNFSFYSSSSMVFINFLTRIIILEFLSKELCGVLFACIAIGSIPGSIFNNSFGPYLIKNKINLFSKNYFYLFVFLFFASIYAFYFQNLYINELVKGDSFKYNSLYFSYMGSYLMIIALYFRQVLLFKNKIKLQKIFLIDVINSFVYLIIVLSVCYLNIKILFSLIFLIFSIYNFSMFCLYFYIDKYIEKTNKQ